MDETTFLVCRPFYLNYAYQGCTKIIHALPTSLPPSSRLTFIITLRTVKLEVIFVKVVLK